MTATVNLRLIPIPELKKRIAALAIQLETTPHAFMLAAIAEKTAIEES